MAAPHVAGGAALLLSQLELNPVQARAALESTVRDLGSDGWGLVDAKAALKYVMPPDL